MLASIGLFSLVLFVELGIIARTGPLPIDTSVALWFKAHRTPGEVQAAQILSALATPQIVVVVATLLILFLNYWTRSWYPRDFLPLALLATCVGVSLIAKASFGRVRPGAGLTTLFDFEPSYPSGHITFIAAAGCAFFFYAGKHKLLIQILTGLVASLVSIARLTLGVHWFTDTIGSSFLIFGLFIIFYVIDDWLEERERMSL